jgi:NAD-dependent dihydropyrimidine dehydrogenase PreA subunit
MKWTANHITYEYDEDKCTCGLGLCAEACGQGVLDFVEGPDKMEIVNEVQCIFCRQCEDVCPSNAISILGALTLDDVRGMEKAEAGT